IWAHNRSARFEIGWTQYIAYPGCRNRLNCGLHMALSTGDKLGPHEKMSWVRSRTIALAALILCAATAVMVLAKVQGPRASLGYQLVLVDRDGRRSPVGPLPTATFAPRISPDGREVVFDTSSDG